MGDALSENTGLRSLSLAWNCIRGRGAVTLASDLGVIHLGMEFFMQKTNDYLAVKQ